MTTAAVAILQQLADKKKLHFDETQARWDCVALIGQYRSRKKGWHKSASPARVMAELAGDTYHFHTSRYPGHAIPTKRKSPAITSDPQEISDGHYPKFITALLSAAGVSCSKVTVNSACREARKKLDLRVGLKKLPRTVRGQDHPIYFERDYRNKMRGRMLVEHVAGDDELGFVELGGYEPARSPARKAVDAFRGLEYLAED